MHIHTHTHTHTHTLTHRDLGLDLFGSLIISQGRVRNRVVKGILALIHRERFVESIRVVTVLMSLHIHWYMYM